MDAAPQSIEEVLAGAIWVMSLTDPALCLDRLHETFTEVIFCCIPADLSETADGEPVARLRTAADRLRAAKAKESLRRELAELQDNTYVDEEEDASAQSVLNAEDEADDAALDMDDDEDDDSSQMGGEEFLAWIHRNDARRAEERAEVLDDGVAAVELELHRVGLGEEDRRLTEDVLPERLKAVEVREGRPRLGARRLPGGYTYCIDAEQEAFWVLRQLRAAGQPLAHNTRICAIANRAPAEAADEPIVVAIAFALRMMTREFLEPAHLMLYHQSALHPLLFALFEASPLMEAADTALPLTSLAYSTRSGRRQRPILEETFVGFDDIATRNIGEGDTAWGHYNTEEDDFVQHKPCFVELGRLLVRILELDVLCHRLECQRQQMLLRLRDYPEPSVQEQRVALEGIVFESAVEADFWQAFVTILTAGAGGRGPTQTVKALGLEDAFEEYTITGTQYQENHVANAPIHVCPPQTTEISTWAEQVGATARVARHADAILALFNQAIVEQFSKLPFLRRRLFEVFCAEGDLILTHRNCRRDDEVYSLAGFFVEHPRHYLDLLERERQGSVELHYVLSDELVRRELNLRQLYDSRLGTGDEWAAERERAMELLMVRLVDGLVPKVKAELRQIAQVYVHTQCVERLGLLCAQGPYEPTLLRLEAFDPDALTWDPEWNIVEALPALPDMDPRGKKPLARVCAAYRGDNGVTHFSFIDDSGALIGATRWADCSIRSESGRALNQQQNVQLERLFAKCCPSVIAVGAGGASSLGLMHAVMHFVQDRVHESLHVSIPVIWAPVDVARLYGATLFADLEFPHADSLARASVALARYVQDPLSTICVLFDKERTALRLPLGAPAFTSGEEEDRLYARLSWEMSLWVTSVGVWSDDCARRPHAVASLQFVAGLGHAKARRLQQLLTAEPPGSRAACQRCLMERFGNFVARNATSSIRIPPPLATHDAMHPNGHATYAREEDRWSPLDETIVPVDWYPAARRIARAALQGTPSALAWTSLLRLPPPARRALLHRVADLTRGERHASWLRGELLAAGRSALRRPFRRLSYRELMHSVTGVSLAARRTDAALVLCDGDYVAGSVVGVRGGAAPAVRLATSRGVAAVIAADDIPDEAMRRELLAYEAQLREARGAAITAPLRVSPPGWLQRGALIQGTLLGCAWERCELRLQWCRARGEGEPAAPLSVSQRLLAPGVAKRAAPNADAASSVNSVRTVRMELEARVFATKISRHPFFRDVSSAQAVAFLHDKRIGEVILRPATARRNRAIAVVKFGERCTCNWLISEERRPNGAIFYRLQDNVTGRELEFGDVDEFLGRFVTPMTALVLSLRRHRRFVPNARDVPDTLESQRRSGIGFTYAFAEVGHQAKPPFYRVFTRAGTAERNYYLHVDDSSIYLRVPIRRVGGGGVDLKWIRCRNAEHVSEVVKGLARPR